MIDFSSSSPIKQSVECCKPMKDVKRNELTLDTYCIVIRLLGEGSRVRIARCRRGLIMCIGILDLGSIFSTTHQVAVSTGDEQTDPYCQRSVFVLNHLCILDEDVSARSLVNISQEKWMSGSGVLMLRVLLLGRCQSSRNAIHEAVLWIS